MSQTRELVQTLKEHIGKLELRGEEIWMCLGSMEDGLRWKPVLTADQLWDAIDLAQGKSGH